MKPKIGLNSLPVHPEALKKYSYTDFIIVSDEEGDLKDSQHFHKNNTSACGFCNAPDAKQIYYHSYGSLAGGTNKYCYHCSHCEKYTYFIKDWG